jgi:hypothetical protein
MDLGFPGYRTATGVNVSNGFGSAERIDDMTLPVSVFLGMKLSSTPGPYPLLQDRKRWEPSG